MPRTLISACTAFILAIALGGCANQNSIFRKNVVAAGNNPMVFTVDAKQRHLIVAPDKDGNTWRTCAEAPPDVFSALSTSAAADLGFGRSGTQTNAQAKAALAIAESAGTIERTQTINLLRESMYRTCERYLSGAIDRSSFAVQAGRDWRAMIGILAIEQLTRAARPPATIIAAGTTSAIVQNESEAIREVKLAYIAEGEAREAKENADNDVKSVCADTSDENKPACEAKKQIAAAAEGAHNRAIEKLETWKAIAKAYGPGPSSSASTGTGTNDPGGLPPPRGAPSPTPTDMAAVATTVGDIVHWAFDTDETQLFCIQSIQQGLDPTGNLSRECLNYLIQRVQAEKSLFATPEVQAVRITQGEFIRGTRNKVAQFLEELDDATYASERSLIAAKAGSFCAGLSRDDCIDAVRAGAFDPKAPLLSAVVSQRIEARGER